jgi:DNA polymerase III epsilon subunit-like protein
LITYIGIDGEMSGTELSSGHKLIQIGMAKYVNGEMTSVGYLINPGEMAWSMQAQEVHQFTKEDIELSGFNPAVVDDVTADWANPNKEDKGNFVMVGFNVGSFDRPFIKDVLPKLYSRFSRRSVDINSLIFAMSNNHSEFEKIKAAAKEYAFIKMEGMFNDFKNRQHDAEYDAVMSLYCFEYLRSLMK